MMRKYIVSILGILLSLLAVAAVYAQEGGGYPTDDDVNRVAKKLYCPVCPNTPLDVCETKACQDWRAQIKDELTAGWTEEQVIEYFVAQYGERVLAEPRRSGFTGVVWLMPLILVTLGLIVVALVLRGWKARRAPPVPVPSAPLPDLPPDVRTRLEEELRKMA